jgi:hypothetical protein
VEILYAIAIAGVLGAIVRYVLPDRQSYGIALAPAISAAVAALVWMSFAWVGWDWSNLAIWLYSLAAGLAAAILLVVLAPPVRRRSDAAFFEQARRARA